MNLQVRFFQLKRFGSLQQSEIADDDIERTFKVVGGLGTLGAVPTLAILTGAAGVDLLEVAAADELRVEVGAQQLHRVLVDAYCGRA